MNHKKVLKQIILILIVFGGILQAQNADTLWMFSTGTKILSSPVLAGNLMLVGSDNKYFYALNSITGEETWKFQTNYPVRSTAVVHGNNVFIESGNVLYCLDMSGNEIWSFDLYTTTVRNSMDDWDYFHSSPVIYEDNIYICTEKGLAYGINPSDGTEIFRVQTESKALIRTTPAISNGKIYFGDWDGKFYCYDLSTSEQVWMYNSYPERAWSGGAQITTSPVVAEGKVYFAGRGSVLFCLDAETGGKLWSFRSPTSQWLVGGPAYEDGVIYLGSSDQRWFRAFNAETGSIIWQIKVPVNLFCTPRIAGNLVYFGTGHAYNNNQGNLITVDKATGDIINQLNFSTAIYSSPVCENEVYYFCTYDGMICAVNNLEVTGINEQEINQSYELKQNYPNPFNPSSTIEYSLSENTHVSIEIYDSIGRLITTLIDEYKPAGKYKTEFAAENLSSGTYFYTLKAGSNISTRKMLLIK